MLYEVAVSRRVFCSRDDRFTQLEHSAEEEKMKCETDFNSAVLAKWTKSFVQSPVAIKGTEVPAFAPLLD